MVFQNEIPTAISYFNLFLKSRQCNSVDSLIKQAIPVGNDVNFGKAYEMASAEYRDFLDKVKNELLNACHLRFLEFAFKKDNFFMRQWASHYGRFGDVRLANLHEFIISCGGLDTEEILIPGIYLKLSEIYMHLSKENPSLAATYTSQIELAFENFGKNMDYIKSLIIEKRMPIKNKIHEENVIAAKYLSLLNSTVKQAFDMSEEDVKDNIIDRDEWENKTVEDAIYSTLSGYTKKVEEARKSLKEAGIVIKSRYQIAREQQSEDKAEKYSTQQIIKAKAYSPQQKDMAVMTIKTAEASEDFRLELIDIWSDPKSNFTKKSGIEINNINRGIEHSDIPAERYIAAGEIMLSLGLQSENIAIAMKCFDKSVEIGGEKYSVKAKAAIEKYIDRSSTDLMKISSYCKLLPNDAILHRKYIAASTNNFSLRYPQPREFEYNKYDIYIKIAKECSEATEKIRHTETITQLEQNRAKAEDWLNSRIKIWKPHIDFILEHTQENDFDYKKQLDNYIANLNQQINEFVTEINNKIAEVNMLHNYLEKRKHKKSFFKKLAIVFAIVIVLSLALVVIIVNS